VSSDRKNRSMSIELNHIDALIDGLLQKIDSLQFGPPVTHVYNPLIYARANHVAYWRKYGLSRKEVILLGMNPGPWGMAQSGVPFGQVSLVKEWLGIVGSVQQPEKVHAKRPILGLACPRNEVSGQRLWGWAKNRFQTPERFFQRFWVANYCPLVFMEAGGRNRTPDKLPGTEKVPLFAACDNALRQTVQLLQPRCVVGIGTFAAQRAASALKDTPLRIGRITHPSPANPKANRGWDRQIEKELKALGIFI
jgi:single-strand selective monofunctional uracil DNA glycosylase